MTENDRAEFGRVLHALAAMKGRELTPDMLALWWACLADWPLAEFKSAAAHLLKHGGPFMPQPGDFLALRKAALPTAGEAWAKVLDHVRHQGRGPLDPATDRAVREFGGYERVANCHTDQLGWLEKSFRANYEGDEATDEARVALAGTVRRLK